MIDKLLPCPFCGESEEVYATVLMDETDYSKVECPNCNACVFGDNLLIAKQKWNKRS